MSRQSSRSVVFFACILFLLLAWWGGLRTSFGLFLKIINEENLWSIASLSLAQSINLLFYGLVSPLLGGILRKKPSYDCGVLIGGALLIGGGLLLAARSATEQQFFISYGVISGIGMTFLSPTVFNALITRISGPYRAILIGIASAGMGAAMLFLLPFVQMLLKLNGWQKTLELLGAITLLGCLPLTLLMYWITHPLRKQPAPSVMSDKLMSTRSLSPVARLHFMLLVGIPALEFFAIQLFVTHLINLFVVNGIPFGKATLMFGSIGALNVLGRVFSGYLLSRSHMLKVAVANYWGLFIAILTAILLPYTQQELCAALIVCGVGICWAAIIPLSTETIAKTVGTANFPLVYGFAESMIGFLGAAGAAIGGISYEKFGGYTASLLLALCCGVGSLWCYLKIFAKINPK